MNRVAANADVVIAAYNDASTIGRAIESALADQAVATVTVIDDCSHDDTVERARAADDQSGRLSVRALPQNGGPSQARNAALAMGSSEWIAILDADDYFEPDRVSRLLGYTDGADFVADNVVQTRPDRNGVMRRVPLLEPTGNPIDLSFREFVAGNISRPGAIRRELGFLKPLMRRRFLDEHGLRYDETLRLGEDFALYASALARGARFRIAPLQGYIAVLRPTSLSARHSKDDLEHLCAFDLAFGASQALDALDAALLRRHFRSIDARVQWLNVIEAVKCRNIGGLIQPFFRSFDVSAFIAARLAEQAVVRARRAFGGGGAGGS